MNPLKFSGLVLIQVVTFQALTFQALMGQTQTPAPPAAVPTPASAPMRETLKVYVLEGQGAVFEIQRGLPPMTVVEVHDENDRPIERADVLFRILPGSPGAAFANNQATSKTRTNAQGQAQLTGLIPPSAPGPLSIVVTATIANRMGSVTIRQTGVLNMADAPKPVSKNFFVRHKWPLIIAGSVGLGAGVYFGTRGSSTAPTTVTIGTGVVTVGGPK